MVMRAQDQCGVCQQVAMQRAFYAFACRHFIHVDCIERYLQPHLKTVISHVLDRDCGRLSRLQEETSRIAKLREEERALVKNVNASRGETPEQHGSARSANGVTLSVCWDYDVICNLSSDVANRLTAVRKELDSILSSQCPLCGPLMIE
jgi:hypothetical protein